MEYVETIDDLDGPTFVAELLPACAVVALVGERAVKERIHHLDDQTTTSIDEVDPSDPPVVATHVDLSLKPSEPDRESHLLKPRLCR